MATGRRAAGAAGIAAVACFAAVALGAPATINDVVLETSSPTTRWDAEDPAHANYAIECLGLPGTANSYSPVNDGDFDGVGDAFDAGLVLSVGTKPYTDSDLTGNLTGEQLKTGPEKFGRLRVTRTDRALSPGTTLRSLIKLKNKSRRKPLKSTIGFGSNMGSDSNTDVRDSSAGPANTYTKSDRWVITSDSATNPSDPPVIHALYGRGQPREKVTRAVRGLDPASTEPDCLRVNFRLKIPPRKTRYLLFFTDMTDAISNEDAIERSGKYDQKRPSGGILAGLTQKVRQRVLNWDLTN